MNIAPKYAALARSDAERICAGVDWYPRRSRKALVQMGFLSRGNFPNNIFAIDRRGRLDHNQLFTALAMVIAVASDSHSQYTSKEK